MIGLCRAKVSASTSERDWTFLSADQFRSSSDRRMQSTMAVYLLLRNIGSCSCLGQALLDLRLGSLEAVDIFELGLSQFGRCVELIREQRTSHVICSASKSSSSPAAALGGIFEALGLLSCCSDGGIVSSGMITSNTPHLKIKELRLCSRVSRIRRGDWIKSSVG